MKDAELHLRLTTDEKMLLKKAAIKLHMETGIKPLVTRAILYLTKVYLNN